MWAWYNMVYGMDGMVWSYIWTWYGMVWYNMVWYKMVHGMVWTWYGVHTMDLVWSPYYGLGMILV